MNWQNKFELISQTDQKIGLQVDVDGFTQFVPLNKGWRIVIEEPVSAANEPNDLMVAYGRMEDARIFERNKAFRAARWLEKNVHQTVKVFPDGPIVVSPRPVVYSLCVFYWEDDTLLKLKALPNVGYAKEMDIYKQLENFHIDMSNVDGFQPGDVYAGTIREMDPVFGE